MKSSHLLAQAHSPFEARCVAFIYIVSAVSLWSLILLALGSFTPFLVGMGALGTTVVTGVLMRRSLFSGRLVWQEWVALGLVILGVLLRSNPATFLMGGQDPGVYASMAGHFANQGTLDVHDPLLPELKSNPGFFKYYLANSTHGVRQLESGAWIGAWVPGVYLRDFESNNWVFQFYAVHPAWLAIGKWIFGTQGQTWILVIFSAASIVVAYLITRLLTGAHLPALAVAFLLATNPAHSYMATFPVSETVASFFFLSTLYLLLHQKFLSFLVPLTGLFLTRITGFFTAPLLLVSLGWIVLKRRDVRAAWAGLGVILSYTISFYWGLWFSPNYSKDIYRSKLDLDPALLTHTWVVLLAVAGLWALSCWGALRFRKRLKVPIRLIMRYRRMISFVVVAAIFAIVLYRGYLLGFTDHYNTHRWFGARWGMAGLGMKSIRYLSAYTLWLMLSPIGFVLLFGGLVHIGSVSIRRAKVAPLAFLTAGFAAALLIAQLTTPYLYYYGRYLVSELLPLAVITGALWVSAISRQRHPLVSRLAFAVYPLTATLILLPALQARLSLSEGKEFTEAMECINEITTGKSVILIDRQKLALSGSPILTPLRIAYGKSAFAFQNDDVAAKPELLGALVQFFQSQGREVYILSSQKKWDGEMGFKTITRIPLVVKKIGGRTEPPTKITTRAYPMLIFSQQASPKPLPAVCQTVKEYEEEVEWR